MKVHDNKIGNGDIVESSLISDTSKDVLDPNLEEDVAGNLETNSESLKIMHDMQRGNESTNSLQTKIHVD